MQLSTIICSAIASIGNLTFFFATCWFFGRNLYASFKHPIGLVATDWGGTPVEACSSPDALKNVA